MRQHEASRSEAIAYGAIPFGLEAIPIREA